MRNSLTVLGVAVMAVVLFGALAGVVQAVDGVTLIDQNDPAFAGFPVIISQPGSYRLASNLTVPNENTTAVQITAENVTLDLNGFAILGPVLCSGSPPVCSPQGTGTGVSGGSGVTVINGTIRGMGNAAISLGNNATIRRVSAFGNAGSVAIFLVDNSTASDNTVSNNAGEGIFGRRGNMMIHNVVSGNGFCGLNTTGSGGTGSTIGDNTVTGNRSGICAAAANLVSGNTVSNNSTGGLDLQPTTGYANNVLNNPGAFFGDVHGGVNLGHNLCGNALCP